jgi:glycosyltransferase involved in cell wall biosynthesis
MNIVNVISSLTYGGAETQVMSTSKELVHQGHQVTIITTEKHAPRAQDLDGSGVVLICLNKQYKLDFLLLKDLREQFKHIKPDIIHAYLYDAEFYSRLAVFGLGITLINSERNDNYKLSKAQNLGHFFTKNLVDGVIANSYAGQKYARARYKNLPEKNIKVVWNGIDLAKVDYRLAERKLNYKEKWFPQEEIKLAVMTASVKPQKNYNLALRVAEELIEQDPNWRVIFLGDKLSNKTSNYKADILEQLEKLTHKSKIKFIGNRDDVLEILSQADISFLTSHHEGFPNTVLESMAVSTPVVTTEFSDINKIAVEPWLVQKENCPVAFVRVINRVIETQEVLSCRSRKWVEHNCSIEKVTTKLLDIYKEFNTTLINET